MKIRGTLPNVRKSKTSTYLQHSFGSAELGGDGHQGNLVDEVVQGQRGVEPGVDRQAPSLKMTVEQNK